MPQRSIFACDPVTRVNDDYGVCITSGSGGPGGVGRAGLMLAGRKRDGEISALTGKISH